MAKVTAKKQARRSSVRQTTTKAVPTLTQDKSIRIEKAANGFIVTVNNDGPHFSSKKFVAKTKAEAKKMATKALG